MKITCEARDLEELSKVASATIGRYKREDPHWYLHQFITIEASSGKAVVKASDTETMIIGKLPAIVEGAGKVQILPRTLSKFIKREKGKVIIESSKNELTIRGDGTTLVVPQEKEKEIAEPHEVFLDVNAVFSAKYSLGSEFPRKIGWAWPYSAGDFSRPVLATVCISSAERKIQMAAADGFRLITVDIGDYPTLEGDDFRINVPRKCCQLISRFMVGDVEMGFDDKKVWFGTDRLRIISQLCDGNYPQYKSLIPTGPPIWTAKMSAPLLQDRLLQFESMAGIVRFIGEEDAVALQMAGDDEASFEALVPAETQGIGKIAVNARYMLPPCSIFSELSMEVTIPSQPLKIRGDLAGVMIVIMPMFVDWDDNWK